MREHILKHVTQFVVPQQHGFVSGRSCWSNLLETIDIINDIMANGDTVDIFYLDFQKAFDTVPHHRLLVKLKNYGITGRTLQVISDFLSGRSFTVKVGDSESNTHNVTSGIPQGSVLGPLLFLLYINDLPDGIKNHVSLFADDAKMCGRSSTPDQNQEDLDKLNRWQKLWLLNFNTSDGKCKVMHVGQNNPKNVYHLGGFLLPTVEIEKDLGVHMTCKFDWKDHISYCVGKATSVMAWITRTVISRDAEVLINLYKSLVRPHLEYCVHLWAPFPRHGNWECIMEIEGVQRKFTRLIDGIGTLSYEERLKKLSLHNSTSLTTLLERRARGDLIETFKIVNGFVNYGKDLFKISRCGLNLVIPPVKGKPTQEKADFFSRRVVRYWNKLPYRVQSSPSVNSFKSRLQQFKVEHFEAKGNYWSLSEDILNKIRLTDINRTDHIAYLHEHPYVAKSRWINLK